MKDAALLSAIHDLLDVLPQLDKESQDMAQATIHHCYTVLDDENKTKADMIKAVIMAGG